MHGFDYIAGALSGLTNALMRAPVPLAIRLCLATLFLVAGIYKLRHPAVAAMAVVNFRVISKPERRAGFGVGFVEVVLAALLVTPNTITMRLGSVGAGLAALAYSFVISRALAQGGAFECNCLPLTTGPISFWSLARSVGMFVLAGLAAAASWQSGTMGGSISTAVAIAAGLFGLPTAVFVTVKMLSLYRHLTHNMDWTWAIMTNASQVSSQSLVGQQA